MNPKVLKLAQLLARRPKDSTIALFRITGGLMLIGLGFFGGDLYSVDFPGITAANERYFEYGMGILGLFPLFGGLTRMCLIKHSLLRKLQMVMGVVLIFMGFPIMDANITQTVTSVHPPEAIELGAENPPEGSTPYNPGWILGLFGFIPLFLGATGKGTYSHCIKYKEKITKIRV